MQMDGWLPEKFRNRVRNEGGGGIAGLHRRCVQESLERYSTVALAPAIETLRSWTRQNSKGPSLREHVDVLCAVLDVEPNYFRTVGTRQ